MSPVEIVRDMYDAFARKDNERVLRLFHPEIEWIQTDGFPGGGRYVGAEAVLRDVFGTFRADWETWKVEIDEYLDAGDAVIVLGWYVGTYKATGRSMRASFAHVYTVRDGRIVRFVQYTDTALIAGVMA